MRYTAARSSTHKYTHFDVYTKSLVRHYLQHQHTNIEHWLTLKHTFWLRGDGVADTHTAQTHIAKDCRHTADLHDRHHHTVEVCTGTGKAHFTHYKLSTHTIGCLHTHLPICMHFYVPSTCTYYMYQHYMYVTYMYRYIDIYFLLLPLLTCCTLCLDRTNLRGFIVSIRTAI